MSRQLNSGSNDYISTLNSSFQLQNARRLPKENPIEEVELSYREHMQGPLSQARQIEEADIVVGIPFYNETDGIVHVLETAVRGLEEFYPNSKCVILAVGSPVGGEALAIINALPQDKRIRRMAFMFDDERINGKGWSVRAITEITQTLGADLVVLEADLESRNVNGEIEGLAPDWIGLLLEPIKMQVADMVISRFESHYFEAPISTLVTAPLLTAVYDCPIHRLVGGQWG
ncbi:MAG: glycosyltransferase, partial [Chloroflexota bacterium]|nr:glycosyltransferase [Chloroflexota bacterium]